MNLSLSAGGRRGSRGLPLVGSAWDDRPTLARPAIALYGLSATTCTPILTSCSAPAAQPPPSALQPSS